MSSLAIGEIARIDWASYRDASGSASQVGTALRDLLMSVDVQTASGAWERIEEYVFSQGTIYSVAEPTVSVLLAALAEDQPPWRSGRIVDLLFFVLSGSSETEPELAARCTERARTGVALIVGCAMVAEGWARQNLLDVLELIAPSRSELIRCSSRSDSTSAQRIGIFDVGYREQSALVRCVVIDDFADPEPRMEWAVPGGTVGPYIAGELYRRELGPLIRAIRSAGPLSMCVIDGYVDLGANAEPGLGRILHEEVGIPVIGVAKSFYQGTPSKLEVLRGSSSRPLFVSAAGFDSERARASVQRMAGSGRIPTMLRRADQLSRFPSC